MNVASMESTSQNKPKLNITFADKEAANSLTINYVDDQGSPLKDPTVKSLSGKSIGDKEPYAFSKYIEKNGDLYVTDGTVFSTEADLTEADTSIDIVYKATGAKGAFFEAEDYGGNADVSKATFSGGNSAVRRNI